jgi:hypothetical protein
MQDEVKLALDHAWRHFRMHAEQRITVFNFFVASAGLLVTSLAYTLQAPRSMWPLGLAASLLLVVISFVFWKLDARVSSIIKSSEEVVGRAEAILINDPGLRVVSAERELTAKTQFGMHKAWTYGQSFRRIFSIMALIGVIGIIAFTIRACRLDELPWSTMLSRH